MSSIQKPKIVSIAVKLLYFTNIWFLVSGFIQIFVLHTSHYSVMTQIGILLAFSLINFAWFYQISKGKNWARILFVVFATVMIIGFITSPIHKIYFRNTVYVLDTSVSLIMFGSIAVCLITPNANKWFSQQKELKKYKGTF